VIPVAPKVWQPIFTRVLDHAPGIDAVHRLVGQSAGAIGSRAEEGGLAAIADTGDLYPILFTA
jgi:hypothetical protein